MNDDDEPWRCPVCHSDDEYEEDAIRCSQCDRLVCDGCIEILDDEHWCDECRPTTT